MVLYRYCIDVNKNIVINNDSNTIHNIASSMRYITVIEYLDIHIMWKNIKYLI